MIFYKGNLVLLDRFFFATVLPSSYRVRFHETVALYKQHGSIKGKRNQNKEPWQDEPNTCCTNTSFTPRAKGSWKRATKEILTIFPFIDIPVGQEVNQ